MIMTRSVLIIAFFLCISSCIKAIDVSVSCLGYYQDGPYIEIYSRIIGGTTQFLSVSEEDSLLNSSVEFLVVIKDERNQIKLAEKYQVNSPESIRVIDYWDLRRFRLDPGIYNMELQYVDLNQTQDTFLHREKIRLTDFAEPLVLSDVLLLNEVSMESNKLAFSKASFSFEPLIFESFGPDNNQLYFFAELYGADGVEQDIYYMYYVMEASTLIPKTQPGFKKISKTKNPVAFENFEIENLESGNYTFVLEVVNKEKATLTRRERPFTVYHPYTDYAVQYNGDSKFETSFVQTMDDGELNYNLKAIFPLVPNTQNAILNDLVWSDNIDAKKYFLYNFWTTRSQGNAKEVFDKYMEVARAVDRKFTATLGHGFETDRGYMFLKYGRPDDLIEVLDEPSAPPYEIWIYNHLPETNQTGVKFLFYNIGLAPNDYRLLHSNCRGELQNPRWEVELYKADRFAPADSDHLTGTTVNDAINRNARRYFSDN